MEDGYSRRRHCVYKLTYYVVFVVKYRRPVITEEIGAFILKRSRELLEGWNGNLLEGGFEPDHVHLLIGMDPSHELSKYISAMKQRISREVRENFPEQIERYLWGGGLWTPSFFITTTGGAPLEKIREYVAGQGNEPQPKKH